MELTRNTPHVQSLKRFQKQKHISKTIDTTGNTDSNNTGNNTDNNHQKDLAPASATPSLEVSSSVASENVMDESEDDLGSKQTNTDINIAGVESETGMDNDDDDLLGSDHLGSSEWKINPENDGENNDNDGENNDGENVDNDGENVDNDGENVDNDGETNKNDNGDTGETTFEPDSTINKRKRIEDATEEAQTQWDREYDPVKAFSMFMERPYKCKRHETAFPKKDASSYLLGTCGDTDFHLSICEVFDFPHLVMVMVRKDSNRKEYSLERSFMGTKNAVKKLLENAKSDPNIAPILVRAINRFNEFAKLEYSKILGKKTCKNFFFL